jgi:hypothetical protein
MSLFRSYLSGLTDWLTDIAKGYAITAGLVVIGAILVLAALGFGVGAAFRAVEDHYTVYIAYAAIGGAFLIAGAICIATALMLSRRPRPPAPPLAKIVTGSIAAPAAARLIAHAGRQGGLRPAAATQVLALLAGAALIGWVASSRWLGKGVGGGP